MKHQIREKDLYCFKATLQHLEADTTFDVSFKVVAEDIFAAQTILEEWLKKPEQTGYKFSRCVGITREASTHILLIKERI